MLQTLIRSCKGLKTSNWCHDLVAATRFLTCLQLKVFNFAHTNSASATRAFPLVGALIGFIGGLAFSLAIIFSMPGFLAGLAAFIVIIFVTGGLHEDGLADTADGLGGGPTHDSRIKIMRDSQTGTFGSLALSVALLAKVGAVSVINDSMSVTLALITSGSLSRGVLPWIMLRLPLASEKGVAATFGKPTTTTAISSLILCCAISVLCTGFETGSLLIVLTFLSVWTLGRLFYRFFGGYTGDHLGATQQIVEIVVLLGVVALI